MTLLNRFSSGWDIADDLLAEVPDEELNHLPPDGAAQVDHYVYGLLISISTTTTYRSFSL